MRILFITSTRVGDAVISTGILAHLLRQHPAARVTVVCGPVAEGVFARMPQLERLIVLAKRKYSLHWWDLLRLVVPRRWDLVVDLRGSATAYVLRAGRRLVLRGGRAEVKEGETAETAPKPQALRPSAGTPPARAPGRGEEAGRPPPPRAPGGRRRRAADSLVALLEPALALCLH